MVAVDRRWCSSPGPQAVARNSVRIKQATSFRVTPVKLPYPSPVVSLCRTLGCSLTCRCRRRSSLQRVLTGVGLQRAVVAATTSACGYREQDPVAGCEEDGRIPDPRRCDGERFEEWLTGRRYFDWSTQARRRCEFLARALGSLSRLAVDTPGWSTFYHTA